MHVEELMFYSLFFSPPEQYRDAAPTLHDAAPSGSGFKNLTVLTIMVLKITSLQKITRTND
jgi:hypothetical protein